MWFRFSHNCMEIPWVKCMGLGKIRTDNAQWLLISQSISMPSGVSLAIYSLSFKLVKSLADKTMLLTIYCHWNLKVKCVWSVELANRADFWGIWTLFILKPFICSFRNEQPGKLLHLGDICKMSSFRLGLAMVPCEALTLLTSYSTDCG